MNSEFCPDKLYVPVSRSNFLVAVDIEDNPDIPYEPISTGITSARVRIDELPEIEYVPVAATKLYEMGPDFPGIHRGLRTYDILDGRLNIPGI